MPFAPPFSAPDQMAEPAAGLDMRRQLEEAMRRRQSPPGAPQDPQADMRKMLGRMPAPLMSGSHNAFPGGASGMPSKGNGGFISAVPAIDPGLESLGMPSGAPREAGPRYPGADAGRGRPVTTPFLPAGTPPSAQPGGWSGTETGGMGKPRSGRTGRFKRGMQGHRSDLQSEMP